MKPTALIVAPTLHSRLVGYLADANLDVHVVTSFEGAKAELIEQPDLLIAEVRLAAFNGLHLALRAQARGIPTIIIGGLDRIVERDAERFGAVYLHVEAIDEVALVAKRLLPEPLAALQIGVPAGPPAVFDLPDMRPIALAG